VDLDAFAFVERYELDHVENSLNVIERVDIEAAGLFLLNQEFKECLSSELGDWTRSKYLSTCKLSDFVQVWQASKNCVT